ncbi:sugar ABC transporter permease [Streptomyces sp. 184]|uniref:sugar ABC transporter permease n=1 Tax=Streptomyces sp. 184 TaxID=1827526 RepID=UPI003891A3AD
MSYAGEARGPAGSAGRARGSARARGPAPPGWAAPALDAVLGRAARTGAEVGDRFPLFADPATGAWTTTRRGSWTGGFWAGLLRLRARHTGAPRDRAAARAALERLAPWTGADTATRGLIFWYGTLFADEAADPADPDADAEELRAAAARACLDSFDPEPGVVPWGGAFGGPRLLARTDGVPGLVPLLASVDPEAAGSHLRVHARLCLGGRPPCWSWRYGAGTGWTPVGDPPPGWSRGPAWLLLAAAEAACHLPEAGLPDVLGALTPKELVPPADSARRDSPPDTSAAAVTAAALLLLGRREHAVAVLRELVEAHLTADGRLLDGCYDLAAGTAVRHELVWGTFFLAYALAMLTGLADPHRPPGAAPAAPPT